ncbi:MAG: hypothetical protein ACJA07_002542 [Rhodococcus sp. (in: high G+C Gram-positive bacteria)]|jgi:hypothetical protein
MPATVIRRVVYSQIAVNFPMDRSTASFPTTSGGWFLSVLPKLEPVRVFVVRPTATAVAWPGDAFTYRATAARHDGRRRMTLPALRRLRPKVERNQLPAVGV